MTRQIDADAVINAVRLAEQGSAPSTPAAGYAKLYQAATGLYFVDDNGVVAGPLGSNFVPSGRLTLTTATPVTTADVTAAATLYYTPYNGNMISLYDGERWIPVVYTEKSLSIAAFTASKPYDIFGYLSSGTLALEGLVWTNDTTRATALAYQDGRLVKTGATTRLYLGTIYVNSSGGQTDDSITKRNVWNYYNRKLRRAYKTDSTSHAYATGAWRAWNNATTNSFQCVVGVQEDATMITFQGVINADADNVAGYLSVGYDASNAEAISGTNSMNSNRYNVAVSHTFPHLTGAGLHTYYMIEYGSSTNSFVVFNLSGEISG